MKRVFSMIPGVALAIVMAGCGNHQSPAVAAEQLRRSYEQAAAPVRQEITQASAALQAGDYAAAIITMDRVTQAHPIDEAQKQAVSRLIQQTRQAMNQNPKLNSPELYKAMSDLVLRVHGEN